MARSFNPPPNWPKPPEGWQPPPGWQPDPAWGPAPEGWDLWTEDPQTDGSAVADASGAESGTDGGAAGAGAAGAAGAGAAAGAGSPSAPSFGGQDAGTGTSRMPQYQGSDAPTTQQSVNSPEPTVRDAGGGQFAANQAPQYNAQGGAGAPYQAGGTGNVPPNSGGSGATGGSGRSKLPWILGAVIALLLVILLVLVLALSGIFGGNDEQASDEETQSQTQDPGNDVSPGGMATADAGATGGGSPTVSEEATRLNVDPEGATEVSNPAEPVETFTQDDGEIELPRPNGDDAPQLISVTSKGGNYVTFEAEREDGSDAYVTGSSSNRESFQLLNTYSFDRGNPVTKVWTEDEDAEFELKVYNLDDLTNVDGGSIKGDGDAVFTVDVQDGSTWYKMSHTGSSNFIVYASTDYEDGTYGSQELAANEIGRSVVYTEYGEGKWLMSVDADGKWGFEESTEQLAREAAVAEIMNN